MEDRLRSDPTLGNFIRFLERDPTLAPNERGEGFEKWAKNIILEDGLLIKKEEKKKDTDLKLVVPTLCRLDLLGEAHDRSHRGIKDTITALQDARYWWPKMEEDVRLYCNNCLICRVGEARVGPRTQAVRGPTY